MDGRHLLLTSANMAGGKVAMWGVGSETIQVDTTYDVLDKMSTVALDGNGVVMLGKVVSCERKDGNDKGGTKNRVCRASLAAWPT